MKVHSIFTHILSAVQAAVVLVFWVQAASASSLTGVTAAVSIEAADLVGPYGGPSLTVPPATLPISVQAQNPGSDDNGGTASGAAMVSGGASPSISVSATADSESDETNPEDSGGFIAGGGATLSYEFEIVGPTTAGQIPVILQGNNSITQTTGSFNYEVDITTELNVTGQNANYYNSTGGSINTTLDLDLDTIYTVYMLAEAAVTADDFAQATALAIVDPTFTAPSGYTIEYSPGLISTTPLPATLPLLLAGLGAMGLVGWRRKRKTQAVAR